MKIYAQKLFTPIIDRINAKAECRYSVAIMVDTEGSEVHLQEIDQPLKVEVRYTLQACGVCKSSAACADACKASATTHSPSMLCP